MKYLKQASAVAAFALCVIGCKTVTNTNKKDDVKETISKNIPSKSSLNLNAPIPKDNTVRKGVLENGMTYYLHATDVKKDVASYYIIQNVGSVLENDNQQGLAHFLEHMAFNGTESFPGKGILDTMEKRGLVFGRDINAYTSFDETVYNINNIPTEPEMIDTGLQVLYDWSNYLLLTDAEIDAERGVIKEEWRSGQSGQRRVSEATIGTLFGHSKYENRLAMGLIPLIETFEYQLLRDFYNDWYRTDLQAIAIVGDIDVDALERKIKAKFSNIPKAENAPERYNVKIENNQDLDFIMVTDKEVSSERIAFNIRHDKSLEDETVQDYKQAVVTTILTNILNNRFGEIKQKANTPFIEAVVAFGNLTRLHNNFSLSVDPKPNMQKEAFTLAVKELNRFVKYGVTNSELKRMITDYSIYLDRTVKGIKDRSHGQIIGVIQQNYLENKTIADVEKQVELTKQIFESLTPDDIKNRIKELYTLNNRNVAVIGVKGNDNLTKQDAISIINAGENDTTLKPYEEEKEIAALLDVNAIKSGSIISISKNEAIDFKTFTLSNGIKVHYKYSEKSKDNVSLSASSKGGMSLLDIKDLPSASIVSSIANLSGLGDFTAIQLQKTGKVANSYVSLGTLSESVGGQSSTADVETMLQRIHLEFTKPRFSKESYDLVIENLKNNLALTSSSLDSKINDSISIALYGKDHPRYRLKDKSFIADISFDKAKRIFKERFANPRDFKFYVIGDISEGTLKPLLEKYIASLPTTKQIEDWKDTSVSWQKSKIDKDFYMPMEDPNTRVYIQIEKDMPYTLKSKYTLNALGKILQLRYIESLREEEGGTYGASAYGNLDKEPKSYGIITIGFDCNPDLAEKLIGIVYKEIEKIKNGDILQSDRDKVITSILKSRTDSKNESYFDLEQMRTFVKEGYDIDAPENFEDIVKSISLKDIQEFTKHIMINNRSYELVFKPKK